MEGSNYLVPDTSWIVEIPINDGKYHQTIASLWISHLVDNIPLRPVIVAHLASAQLTNTRQITIQPGNIISILWQLVVDVTFCSILSSAPLRP